MLKTTYSGLPKFPKKTIMRLKTDAEFQERKLRL